MVKLLLINKKLELSEKRILGIGYFESPIGTIRITNNELGITGLEFVDSYSDFVEKPHEYILEVKKQLKEYFYNNRIQFDIPICLYGTEFQLKVWEQLTTIEYSKTASYKDIAALLGNSKATRAVGGANNKNPVAIIIPCHRIIGSRGNLTGYAGGLNKKEWLLAHEKKNKFL